MADSLPQASLPPPPPTPPRPLVKGCGPRERMKAVINHWKIHAPSPFLKYFLNVHGNAAKLNDMLEKRVARLKSRDQGLRENQLSVYDKALVTLHEEKKDHPQASLELFVQEFLGLEDVPPSQAEETLGRTIKAHEVVNSVKNSRKRTDHGEITEGHEGTKRRKSMIGDAPAAGSDGIVVSGAFDSPQEHWAPQLGSPHQEADSVLQSTEQYDGDNNHHMIGDAPTAGSDGIVVSEAFALPQGHWAPQLGGPHQEFQPTQSSNVTNPEDVLVSDSYVTHLEPLIDPQMFQNWYYSSYQPNHGPLGGVDSQDQDGSEGFNKSFSDLTSS